jgi:hypothetical protein
VIDDDDVGVSDWFAGFAEGSNGSLLANPLGKIGNEGPRRSDILYLYCRYYKWGNEMSSLKFEKRYSIDLIKDLWKIN